MSCTARSRSIASFVSLRISSAEWFQTGAGWGGVKLLILGLLDNEMAEKREFVAKKRLAAAYA